MKFCTKKAWITLGILWGAVLLLPAWELGEKINIQTLDGYYFPNAELMSVNAGGITICYNNFKNEPVVRGITFDRLPVELRVRYGYDPEEFAAYQKGVGTYAPPAQPKPAPTAAPEVSVQKKTSNSNTEKEESRPNLTVVPWDWYYYSPPTYIISNIPGRPGHRPRPPAMHKPQKPVLRPPIMPAPSRPSGRPAFPALRPGR